MSASTASAVGKELRQKASDWFGKYVNCQGAAATAGVAAATTAATDSSKDMSRIWESDKKDQDRKSGCEMWSESKNKRLQMVDASGQRQLKRCRERKERMLKHIEELDKAGHFRPENKDDPKSLTLAKS